MCADGLNPAPLDHLTCANQSICRWPGTQTSGSLGYAIDVGGDVNGDGWADLLVGAPAEDQMRDDVVVGTDSGGVHLWLNPGQGDATTPTASLFGETAGAFMGTAVAIIPDVNGDGLDDILAGGRGLNSDGVFGGGSAVLVLGQVDGFFDGYPRGRAHLARRGRARARGLGRDGCRRSEWRWPRGHPHRHRAAADPRERLRVPRTRKGSRSSMVRPSPICFPD